MELAAVEKRCPSVWAVMPVHNGIEQTLEALASLTRHDYPRLSIVVVDDGSTDGTAERVAASYPSVRILRGDSNLWWSGATNLGVQHALSQGADYLYTINNDVEVAGGAVSALVAAAEASTGALIGSQVRYRNNPERVWYCGATFDRKTGALRHVEADRSTAVATVPSEWLTGMGVLIPAGVFRRIGSFDARRYPQYFGDVDFSLRARAHGYELLVCPQAVVYADVDSSWLPKQMERPNLRFVYDLFMSPRSQHNVRIRVRFYQQHWRPHPWRALARFYARETPRVLNEFLKQYVTARTPPRGPTL